MVLEKLIPKLLMITCLLFFICYYFFLAKACLNPFTGNWLKIKALQTLMATNLLNFLKEQFKITWGFTRFWSTVK